MPRRYAMYTTSDWASPSWPSPLSTAETTSRRPDVVRRSMCVGRSAPLKRWIRSLVNSAAIPDHKVSACGRGAADPDEQVAAHIESNSTAAVPGRRRGPNRDAVVMEACSREPEPDYTGTPRDCTRKAGDDN